MSADIVIVHSEEADDPTALAFGYYIGPIEEDGSLVTHRLVGPYPNEGAAVAGMRRGDWINGKVSA